MLRLGLGLGLGFGFGFELGLVYFCLGSLVCLSWSYVFSL